MSGNALTSVKLDLICLDASALRLGPGGGRPATAAARHVQLRPAWQIRYLAERAGAVLGGLVALRGGSPLRWPDF